MAEHTYRYLIVGGGMTGDAAAKGIREVDADGSIGLVGAETHPPYKRPPLSKGLWSGGDEAKIWRGTEERGVELHLGREIVSLDLDAHRARDDHGDEYSWERLILATGGEPRRLAGDDGGDVVYFRTLDDFRRLRAAAEAGKRFVVVGGGFIGSEIAAALASIGGEVTMLFPEEGIGWRTFPAALSKSVTDYFREKGVQVETGVLVDGVEAGRVRLRDGRTFEADVIVAGLGIEPRVALAQAAGLAVDGGIVVDEQARAGGRDDVFAAGDVAVFPVPALGRSTRVEHEDHANSHGALAGRNAAGAGARYDHIPFFYSDLFDLGYEAVGEVDSRHATVEAWITPGRKGVVAFVDDERRPRGVLLWGIFGKVDDATELIRAGAPVDEDGLRALAG
jgi:3-phenylpropionate/trans-cinnamate dioxygenase ferredoxin reductase component